MDSLPDSPRLTMENVGCSPAGHPSQWRVAWRVGNREGNPVLLLTCWLPHDRFLGERRRFLPPLELQPCGSLELEALVTCSEAPETVFDAAFVILELQFEGTLWRLFARHVITVDEAGVPQADCKSVTIQPVSGSGSDS